MCIEGGNEMITLYIKTHLVTGLKYFGKTQQRDAARYKGSGKRWLRHLAKHGNCVHTRTLATFDDEEIDKASTFAIEFSIENDIVKSNDWANLMVECIVGGSNFGSTLNDPLGIVREKISDATIRMWQNTEKRNKIIESHKLSWTAERRASNSAIMKTKWTPEKKELHRKKMQTHHANNPNNHAHFLGPKTESHKTAISTALLGKAKCIEHICNLKWTKIGGANGFTNYVDYARHCYTQYHAGVRVTTIREQTGTGSAAVYGAINYWPRLNEYLLKKGE